MMPTLIERTINIIDTIRSGAPPGVTAAWLSPDRVTPAESVGQRIAAEKSYFRIQINELVLGKGRQWWALFDPAILAVTEFVHGKQKVAVPKFVGPDVIAKQYGQLPHGLLLNDITVAGPHPFRGDRVALTLILYAVKKSSIAQNLYQAMSNISASIGVPADITAALKVGGAILDTLEALLSIGGNVPVLAQRFEIDTENVGGFRSAYGVLLNSTEVNLSELHVADGRLHLGSATGPKLQGIDYILYSVTAAAKRGEVRTLPFFSLLERAMTAALTNDEKSWARAKATLLSVYQEMVLSPELISAEAQELLNEYKAELLSKHSEAKLIASMPTEPNKGRARDDLTQRLDAATGILELQ